MMVGLDAFFFFFVWLLFWTPSAFANTEKVIFSVPDTPSSALENVINGSNLDPIGQLSPAGSPEKLLLRIELPREFPTESAPRGVDSWVLLKDLKPGARYEARVCWAATTPSDFWLSVHSSLDSSGPSSDLYLKISAIASYYTINATLMENPEPVLVDIILDEFLLGVLPRSLLNVGLFIVVVAGVAWYAGFHLIHWLDGITRTGLKDKVA
ncbi:hypothetical protein TWF481_008012 [Arthrobotrys musiformis]|uniref:Fibronectin type-III domain-containing protein n=1 Tax=Arthrobotrys musiformis TaxID=47236 RepID=A0AAV9W5V7_9PEZI